jgi:hypothetical protein
VFLQQAMLKRHLGIGNRGRFLFVTTSEKKTGFLLIETFSKRNYGHQETILGGLLLQCRGKEELTNRWLDWSYLNGIT